MLPEMKKRWVEALRSENERLRTDLAAAEEALRKVDAELAALVEANEKLRAELRRDRPPFEYRLALDEIVALLEERDRLRGALGELMEWEDEIAANLGLHTNPAPLMAKARAALAKARGEVGDE